MSLSVPLGIALTDFYSYSLAWTGGAERVGQGSSATGLDGSPAPLEGHHEAGAEARPAHAETPYHRIVPRRGFFLLAIAASLIDGAVALIAHRVRSCPDSSSSPRAWHSGRAHSQSDPRFSGEVLRGPTTTSPERYEFLTKRDFRYSCYRRE